ncbi:SMC-Scp complex subunit ScpB [Candidatus Woesearchaeota archaeon]|jgi:segregation and condensation protein B|nr:SMC-Scp complex subunit ScpB [Candidatus Woesearchaeota archaeon]
MELKNKIEALLFASGRKMDIDELARLVKVRDRVIIKEKLIELKKEHENRNSPVMLVEEGTSWKLNVQEQYINLVREINTHTELSKTMMETLAVIAWKQPMLQSDVIKIRTNKAYDHVKELMDMGFVVKERYGRTYLLKLTQKFFDYFDVRNDDSLKALFKDIKEEVIDQKQMSDFEEGENKVEEAQQSSSETETKEETDHDNPEENLEDENKKVEDSGKVDQEEEADNSTEIENNNTNIELDTQIQEVKQEAVDIEEPKLEDNNQDEIEIIQNPEDENNEIEQPMIEEETELTELEKEVNNEDI